MARTLLQKAQISPWVHLGDLVNDAFREADIIYSGGYYHVFSTLRSSPHASRVYKATTLDGILHATPYTLGAQTSVNLSNVTASVDNGNGTVTLTHTNSVAVSFNGTVLRVTGHPAYSNNDKWVIGTRITGTQTSVPGTTTGGTGGSFRIAAPANYPTAQLDAGTWHLWGTNAGGITSRWTTADPITDSSVWTQAQADAFGTGQQLVDAHVRKHPSNGYWYVVGFLNYPDSPMMILRASAPGGPWTVLASDVYADLGEPWWANASRPDPNLAFTGDGKAWVLHSGLAASDDKYRSGMVEIDISTGKAIGTPIVLNEQGQFPWQGLASERGRILSDLNYLQVPGEPDRIFGFINTADVWPDTAIGTTGWGAIELIDPPAGIDERVWVWDRYGTGAYYDISGWVHKYPSQISGKAEGQIAQLALQVLPRNKAGQPLPCPLVGGQEVIYYTWDPDPTKYQYKPSGKINQVTQVPYPGGMAWEIRLEGYERELNAHASFLFFGDTERYDKDRIQALLESRNVTDGNTWDAHTYVQGPFRDYLGVPQGFYRTNLWNVLKTWAQDNGATSPYTGQAPSFRRWYATGQWADPANPGTGAIKRVLHYYESLTGPQEVLPFTDRRDKVVNLVKDSFTRPDYPSLGVADTGQLWEFSAGIWAIDTNRAKLQASTPSGLQYATFVDPGQLSFTASVDFAVNYAPMRFVWRVNPEPNETWKWSGLLIENQGSTYMVRRFTAGAMTNLSAINITPQDGDKIEVTATAGSYTHQIKIYRSGGSVAYSGSVSDATNLNSTRIGLSIDSIQPARWDNLKVSGTGQRYYNWRRVLDYTALTNIIAISGAGGDPTPAEWQNGIRVDAGTGYVAKQDVQAWQASHTYSVNDWVKPLNNPNGRHYRVTVAGTTAASEPGSWPLTEGTTVTSGTVTFICETWNAGAASKQFITEDGGRVGYTVQEHLVGGDSFNRPDGPLGNLETGQTWSPYNGAWWIESNRIKTINAPGTLVFDSGIGSSVIVQATFAALQTGMRLVFRSRDAQNLWYVDAQGITYRLVKRVANVDTVVHTYAVPPAPGDQVKVACQEDAIVLYINGAIQTTVNDAWLMGATRHGVSVPIDGTGVYPARFDDFRCWQTYTTKQLGWSTSTSYDPLAPFAIRIFSDRTAQVYEGGVAKGSPVAANAGDAFTIEVRARMDPDSQTPVMDVNYYRIPSGGAAGSPFYTSATHPTPSGAAPLYVNAALYQTGARFAGVTIRRFTYNVFSDPVSIAKYGRWWAKEMLHDDQLDSYAKRQGVANGIFARYAYPRDTLEIYVKSPNYEWGRRCVVNNTALGWVDVLRVIAEVKPAKKGTGKPTVLVLGDSPYEYGTDEPLGPLFRAPDRDETAPATPLGFATGTPRRDSATTVSVPATWTIPTDDAITLEVELTKLPGGTDAARYAFPARAGAGVMRLLEPSATYRPACRMVDSNNNRSDWVIFPEFTTTAIEPPPPPTWQSPAIIKQGVGQGGTAWVQVGWQAPQVPSGPDAILTPPPVPVGYYEVNWQPGIVGPIYSTTVNGDQITATIPNLATNQTYRIWVVAVDTWGIASNPSTVQTFTPSPPPIRGAGSWALDAIHPDLLIPEADGGAVNAVPGWHWVTRPSGATLTPSQDYARRGAYSLKMTIPASGGPSTAVIEQDPDVVTPDEMYWGWFAYYIAGGGTAPTTLQDQNVWADKLGAAIGSTNIIKNVTPVVVGAWDRGTTGGLLAPSVAGGYTGDAVMTKRRISVVFPAAGGTIYFAPPDWGAAVTRDEQWSNIQQAAQLWYDNLLNNRASLQYQSSTDTTTLSAANPASNTKLTAQAVGDASLSSTSGRVKVNAQNTSVPNVNVGDIRTVNPSVGTELEGDLWIWDDGSGNLRLKINKGGDTSAGGVNKVIGSSQGIIANHRAFSSATSTVSPEPSTDTDISGMSVSFTLTEQRDVLITFHARFNKSAGTTRVTVYDNKDGVGYVAIAPDNGTVYSGFYGSGPGPDGPQQVVSFVTLQANMGAGSHVIKLMHQAAASTNQIQWGDRLLLVQVLG